MRIGSIVRTTCISFLAGMALIAATPAPPKPVVAIATTAGTILVQLDPVAAPVTTKNFLHLVDTGAYNGSNFYRTVSRRNEPAARIEVIQGGLDPRVAPQSIPLETTAKTGLHNTSGAIAMARTADPNSASSEFFICVGDNTFLDSQKYPDHAGYAAFGHVIRGYDIVLRINHAAVNGGESLSPRIAITRITRFHSGTTRG